MAILFPRFYSLDITLTDAFEKRFYLLFVDILSKTKRLYYLHFSYNRKQANFLFHFSFVL